MKILCISDQIDPVVYNSAIKKRFSDIDVILSAGDLPMEYLDFVISSLNKPAYFIFGNHNLNGFEEFHKCGEEQYSHPAKPKRTYSHGAAYAGFSVFKEKNLLIAGASGSMRYNNGKSQYTELEMFFRLAKIIPKLLLNKIRYGKYLDIFLTHAPPFGIHDKKDPCHKGFKVYLWFLRTFKPQFMVHGHIHLYDLQDERVSVYKQTTIINAFEHYVITI